MDLEELCDLHRLNGEAVLTNPDCPDCEREAIAVYRCCIGTPKCGYRVSVDGRFRWSWQGKQHTHEPWSWDAFKDALNAHAREAHGRDYGAWVPVS